MRWLKKFFKRSSSIWTPQDANQLKSLEHLRFRKDENRDSAFYDRAENYVFSDWMFTYCFGTGVDDLSEFHLGGFPDLSTIAKRESDALQLDLVQVEAAFKKPLRLAKLLKREMPHRWIFDLGCGIPEKSFVPRLLSEAFNAKIYVGVDSTHVKNEMRLGEFGFTLNFRSVFVQSDLARFLEAVPLTVPKIFLLYGLEVEDKRSEVADDYLRHVRSLIEKQLKPGDLVLLGAGSPELFTLERGMKNIYEDPYHVLLKKR